MDECEPERQERRRLDAGGIISLAGIIKKHRKAVESDLFIRAGIRLDDIGRSVKWSTVDAVLQNLPLDSALTRELHPEESRWGTTEKTNMILADIFDMLARINANIIAIGSGKPSKQPKPYPRPKKNEPENHQHFGRGSLPPDELRAWFEEKRRKHASSSKRNA